MTHKLNNNNNLINLNSSPLTIWQCSIQHDTYLGRTQTSIELCGIEGQGALPRRATKKGGNK